MVKPIHELLPQVLQQATAKHQLMEAVRNAWPSAVGVSLARHTWPTSLRNAVLYVRADEPGANFLLSLRRIRLLEQLRAATGQAIDDIVVRPGARE